uniref:Uncharacterized protein n=1 Tax=Maylandia zebra TaxID=106582 RepID=A0A3P9B833_9CICH
MDPAAVNPSEELQDDIGYNVEILLGLWLENPPYELRRAVEGRLQRLFSGLPWLLNSLPPTIQAFLRHTPHLLSATPASLPDSPDVILPGPSEPSGPLRPLFPVSAGGSEGPLRPLFPVSAGGSEGPLRPLSPVSAGGSEGPLRPLSPVSLPPFGSLLQIHTACPANRDKNVAA